MNQTLSRFNAEGPSRFNESSLVLAPFFRALRSSVDSLSASAARLSMGAPADIGAKDPHLHTADDAALCALALRAADLALEAGVPVGVRWRLRSYEVAFLAERSTGAATAMADASNVDWNTRGDHAVVVQLSTGSEPIGTATLRITVEPT